MTGRERLTAIYENRECDGPALKLWGFTPGQSMLSPAYEPVYRLAMEKSDWVLTASSDYDTHLGAARGKAVETFRTPGPEEDWEDVTTIWHTPKGDLRSVTRISRSGKPGYDLEHFAKSAEDVEALLSLPYEPMPFDPSPYLKADKLTGDKGICMYGISNAMYMLQYFTGPELFAMMSVENRELMLEAIREFSRRIRLEVDRAFDAGLRPAFAWVGPEVCIPPLMSPRDFDDFVMRFDKPLCGYIHERGGRVWVHCHGKVRNFIPRFIDMGVDVLNPIEPPPMGDITVSQAAALYGKTIGLEGNIETHDLWSTDGRHLEELVRAAVDEGSKTGRFILCPSSGYMEFPNPTERYIENLMIYLNAGYEQANLQRSR